MQKAASSNFASMQAGNMYLPIRQDHLDALRGAYVRNYWTVARLEVDEIVSRPYTLHTLDFISPSYPLNNITVRTTRGREYHKKPAMDSAGFFLYTPSSALAESVVMVEEFSKILYRVDLATPPLKNPTSWRTDGITPTNTGRHLAIVFPVALSNTAKDVMQSQGARTDFEVGKLVAITSLEGNKVRGRIIGRVNVVPFPESVFSWDKLKAYGQGDFPCDEVKGGLLAKAFGAGHPGYDFVNSRLPAAETTDPINSQALARVEHYGMFISGHVVEQGDCWLVSP
ncbi:hypothetical protein MRB53_038910 [Persea americana]|nr:hypothetical protein MRB53_038910 [Persea americana]